MRKILRISIWTILGLLVLGLVSVFGFYLLVKSGSFGPLPSKDELTDLKQATATLVYSSDEQLIGKIFSENRTNATFDELPDNLIHALIATEDARYFEHEGVDQRSLLRVLVKSIILGDESAGGGSTITQQLTKNLYGRRDFAFMTLPVNKTKEIILAGRLEDIYTKEELLVLYLNTVPFSENVYGIETASRRFFNKEPRGLDPQESAVLVGMLKANTYYNPRLHPDNSRFRRNVVLNQMHRYGYLSVEEADSLKKLPLDLDYQNLGEGSKAPYFMAHVKNAAHRLLAEEGLSDEYDLEMDGLIIHTTLNAAMQAYAEEAMLSHMEWLQDRFDRHWAGREPWGSKEAVFERELKKSHFYRNLAKEGYTGDSLDYYLEKPHPVLLYHPTGDTVMEMSVKDSVAYYMKLLHSGFLALQPQDGAVLAWVGGLNHQFLPYDHVLAKRQAASTFKAFVYAAALEQGVDPCEYIPNERRVYEEFDDWAPRNYNNEYGGFYSMQGALKQSVNLAAVHTIFETGVESVLATARDMGIDSRQPDDPTVALGTGNVSLLEMVKAYAVFANGGHRISAYMITRIENSEGESLYRKEVEQRKEQVLDKETTQLMNAMLQGVVNGGTGAKLRRIYGLRNELAGKTGTSQDYTDGWFIGYNPQIVAGVWVGASSPAVHFRSGLYGSGSAMALPVFGKFFHQLSRDADLREYSRARFEDLPTELQEKLDCEDYRDKNLIDAIRGVFKNEPGEKVKEEKKEKKGFFKRLFGGKKD